MWPGHSRRRHALVLGELGGVDPGVPLIWISSDTWPPVTPSDWASRRSSRERRKSTGRSRSASARELARGAGFDMGIINLLNYSNGQPLFT